MKRREPQFTTEAALCVAFLDWLKRTAPGWTPYAETAGWDILLAHADGTQIGIQAKLRCNLHVLAQAIEESPRWCHNGIGPDFRAVLVPEQGNGAEALYIALGISVISPQRGRHWSDPGKHEFHPRLNGDRHRDWHYMNPARRIELPEYIPDVACGVPSPSPLTEWKIAALKISALLELRGYVTREDFKFYGIDHRRWREQWLDPDGAPGRWVWREGRSSTMFSGQHPIVYPQVLADVRSRIAATQAGPKQLEVGNSP